MPIKLIIADDDASTLDLLSFLLTREGYSVSCAADGRQALDLVRRERPDLIITDLAMPDMSGIELIRVVHGDPALQGVPIVVVSAYFRDAIHAAVLAGANGGLHKPIDPDELLDLVKNLLPSSARPNRQADAAVP